jgi:hypothetical protein
MIPDVKSSYPLELPITNLSMRTFVALASLAIPIVHATSSYMTAVIHLVGIRGFTTLDVMNLCPRDLPISDE